MAAIGEQQAEVGAIKGQQLCTELPGTGADGEVAEQVKRTKLLVNSMSCL